MNKFNNVEIYFNKFIPCIHISTSTLVYIYIRYQIVLI